MNHQATPITEAFKKEWPDSRRHNWPCTFESDAFAKIKSIEKDLIKAKSLIDGTFEIVELWNPSTPSQVKWKQEWLESARKLGAGPDW